MKENAGRSEYIELSGKLFLFYFYFLFIFIFIFFIYLFIDRIIATKEVYFKLL